MGDDREGNKTYFDENSRGYSEVAMKKIIVSVLGLSVLSACALQVENAQIDSALDSAAVVQGFSKSQILKCAGKPSKRSKTNTGEVWKYVYEAYKDPELNPNNSWDANYIGVANVMFVRGVVSNIVFATTPRNPLGFKYSHRYSAHLSGPVFRKC